MCPFHIAARVGVRYPGAIEERVELPVYCMVKQPISHRRFMYIPRLRIGDFETLISGMAIGPIFQILMERQDIIHQELLKFLDIFLLSFP